MHVEKPSEFPNRPNQSHYVGKNLSGVDKVLVQNLLFCYKLLFYIRRNVFLPKVSQLRDQKSSFSYYGYRQKFWN